MSITETFSNSIDLPMIKEYDKSVVMHIWAVLGHVYHVACRRVLWNTIYRHLSDHVFGVGNFGNATSIRVIFYSKCSKFKLNLKNAPKNCEKDFCFCDNCIWIGIVKLSLLTTGYFLSAANVLKSRPKSCHITIRDFFRLNWHGSDQWIQ